MMGGESIMFSPSSSSSSFYSSCSSYSYNNQNQNQQQNSMISMIRSPATSLSSCFFNGRRIFVKPRTRMMTMAAASSPPQQMNLRIGKAQKWWEKGVQPNMKEITGAQDFVVSLLNGGDKLVIVDFFSPGCGGCRALHPKICQLAEMNPEVQFLQVNYEEHKSMCYALNIHVLPFFRFYRGAQGRLCSFSCTNATIKKFKDALAKHSPDRCSLGPTKGLEEKELLALSANKDLDFVYTPKTVPIPTEGEKIMVQTPKPVVVAAATSNSDSRPALPLPLPLQRSSTAARDSEEKSLMEESRR